jgi:cytochrome c
MRITAAAVLAIAVVAAGQNSSPNESEKLIQANDCSSCHAVDHEIVGPAYSTIAKKYAGQADAAAKLAGKIRDGGKGMTPHPDLTEVQRRQMVAWILARKDSPPAIAVPSKQYTYKLKGGSNIELDFPLFAPGKGQKVTKEVFHGYQLYNSYCYRCHGTDANGGQLGPDLRHSLAAGMKPREFLGVAMSGRKEKAMPAWAGFLSEDDVFHVYRYVKGRSLDLIPSGRPPSEQD